MKDEVLHTSQSFFLFLNHFYHNGHELGKTLRDDEGQGGLVCCSPWGCKESDTTEQLMREKVDVEGNMKKPCGNGRNSQYSD